MFNYESPINVFQKQIEVQMEGEILKAVSEVGVTVDKEELLKALKYDREQYEKGYQDGLNANRWIPCSERLPEKYGDYLCCDAYGEFVLGYPYKTEEGFIVETENDIMYDCVAWMPSPAPYKGGNSND